MKKGAKRCIRDAQTALRVARRTIIARYAANADRRDIIQDIEYALVHLKEALERLPEERGTE